MNSTTEGLLLAHFETGYKQEVWEPLQEYLDLIKKNNVTIGPIPEFGILPLVTGFMVYPKPTRRSLPSRIPNVPFGGKEMVPEEPNKHVEKTAMDRLKQLQNTLLKELNLISTQLEHGIPLKGLCECCPSRHV